MQFLKYEDRQQTGR